MNLDFSIQRWQGWVIISQHFYRVEDWYKAWLNNDAIYIFKVSHLSVKFLVIEYLVFVSLPFIER